MENICELPDGLTAASLKVARGSEIAFWIACANAAAGKRVMTKNSHVDDQRQRLVKYYGFELTDGTASVTGLISIALKTREEDIKEHQLSWLRELGDEWSRTAAEGKEFTLCDRSSELCSTDLLREAVSLIAKLAVHATPSAAISSALLYLDGQMQTENNKTVSALIGAPVVGTLWSKLQSATTAFAGPAAPLPVLPHVTSDAAVLDSCQLDIESMQRAQDLRDAIEQVENGAVGCICKRYIPRDDRAAKAMWGHLKGKVTKHGRLYGLLSGTFQADRDSFFQFFTVSAAMNDKKRYIDPVSGRFSEQLWRAVWGDQNDWHVWRELGKEWYEGRKAL
ncbi:uncharacterized protein HD556DRAFT_1304769 [Suillus plorans]|uniref:Uncharacterized protein n=1 Tax=Suillus plorans TaxID=116603 RepID=A0A9P7DQN6_9AGAM|nr:uncharacterized protein HD556DRAFT_1304769 [Suillus plorans]KAG1800754.1 hypothetical protein HD556DRAFT_1304769 [Suillus plorans]